MCEAGVRSASWRLRQEVRGLDLQRWGLKVEAMGRIGRKDVPGRRHSIYKGPKMR